MQNVRCTPERLDDGWQVGNCTGLRGPLRGVNLTAFVPAQGESGLEVKLQPGPFTITITLSRIPQRDEPQASANVSLLWHERGNGTHSDIWAIDGLVFAPRLDGRIEVLDAKSGQLLGVASIAGTEGGEPPIVLDVKAHDGLLYAATVSNGVVVFDVSRPSMPELIGQHRVFLGGGSLENFTNIHNIFLSPDGNFVYAINQSSLAGEFPLATSGTDLRIIDVSDPNSPKEAGRFAIEAEASIVHDVNVIERDGRLIAFLNDLKAGLWILDVTDPASVFALSSIKWEGIISHSGWPFALGNKLYYAHAEEGYDRHLTVLNVTDLSKPTEVSRLSTREGVSIHNVQMVDGVAYISYYIDGLRVVDLREPENPREVGHFDTVSEEDERDIFQGAWGVRVNEDIVYISDIETGTYAFQVDLD